MKNDNNGFLSELALGMTMLPEKQKRVISSFISIMLKQGFAAYSITDEVDIAWKVSRIHHSTILHLLRSIRHTPYVSGTFDKFYQHFFFMENPESKYITVTLRCSQRDLLLFFFILFCLWSGHIRYTNGQQVMPRDRGLNLKTLRVLLGRIRTRKAT